MSSPFVGAWTSTVMITLSDADKREIGQVRRSSRSDMQVDRGNGSTLSLAFMATISARMQRYSSAIIMSGDSSPRNAQSLPLNFDTEILSSCREMYKVTRALSPWIA